MTKENIIATQRFMRKIYMSSNEEDLAVAMLHGLSMAKSSGVTYFSGKHTRESVYSRKILNTSPQLHDLSPFCQLF